MAGIILTLLVWLVIVEIIWPASVSLYLIPMSIFIIILWINAWRVTRMKQKASTVWPRLTDASALLFFRWRKGSNGRPRAPLR